MASIRNARARRYTYRGMGFYACAVPMYVPASARAGFVHGTTELPCLLFLFCWLKGSRQSALYPAGAIGWAYGQCHSGVKSGSLQARL